MTQLNTYNRTLNILCLFFKCVCRLSFRENLCEQTVHTKGFSPVWANVCRLHFHLSRKSLAQNGQEYLAAPRRARFFCRERCQGLLRYISLTWNAQLSTSIQHRLPRETSVLNTNISNMILKVNLKYPMLILHVSLEIVFTREPSCTNTTSKWLLASVGINVPTPLWFVQEEFSTERASVICSASPCSVFLWGPRLCPRTPYATWLGAANGKRVLIFPPCYPHHHLHCGLQLAINAIYL